jgi:hypothetical protein
LWAANGPVGDDAVIDVRCSAGGIEADAAEKGGQHSENSAAMRRPARARGDIEIAARRRREGRRLGSDVDCLRVAARRVDADERVVC